MKPKIAKEKAGVTTAFGLWRYGNDFYNASVTLNRNHKESAFMPFFASVGQSIELSLKAYLLAVGFELDVLRKKYGHDLNKLALLAKENNLTQIVNITNIHFSVIELMSKEYSDKKYHYIETGRVMLPSIQLVLEASRILTVELESYCYKNTKWELEVKKENKL